MAATGETFADAGRSGILSSRTKDRLRRYTAAYLFLVPTFIFIDYFLYYPAYRALVGGFTFWDGLNDPQFIGLDNFRRAFDDRILKIVTKNNLIWAAIDVALSIIPAFIVASLILHVRKDGQRYLYRTLFIVPIIIPGIVTILLWRY